MPFSCFDQPDVPDFEPEGRLIDPNPPGPDCQLDPSDGRCITHSLEYVPLYHRPVVVSTVNPNYTPDSFERAEHEGNWTPVPLPPLEEEEADRDYTRMVDIDGHHLVRHHIFTPDGWLPTPGGRPAAAIWFTELDGVTPYVPLATHQTELTEAP